MNSGNGKINEAYLKKALYTYDFDLINGLVLNDIIDRFGHNYTKQLGLTSPCTFDELMKHAYSSEYFGAILLGGNDDECITCDMLLRAYKEDVGVIENIYYLPKIDKYNRVTYYLVPDIYTGSAHVYVSCIDITESEKHREVVYGDMRNSMIETDDIIASAQIGIWHIYLFDGEKPRMSGTPKMLEILGINDNNLSEEEIYEYWFSRVKKSATPSVKRSVNEMMEKGFSENTYAWNHPELGEIMVRCGGTSQKIDGKGYILRGYHSDVTETVNFELKQKQLLSDALDELKYQKKLLQEALDDYKEADYDRRRDFLTGLRNRQDMFELLQDVLSEKHENIKAMFMMDIDNFKLFNDHYGHVAGDECLKAIGKTLNEYGAKNDIYFYRYGGEEILGIYFSDVINAKEIAEEIVELIYNIGIKRDDVPTGVVTISLGYTTDNKRYEKMIDKADSAMYMAKSTGKNRAVCFEDIEE